MQNLYRGCVVTDRPLRMQALRDTPRVWAQTYLPAPLAGHLPQQLLHSWARCEHLRINRISQGVDSGKFPHLPFGETLESVSRQSCPFGTLQPQHPPTHSLTHSLRVAAAAEYRRQYRGKPWPPISAALFGAHCRCAQSVTRRSCQRQYSV